VLVGVQRASCSGAIDATESLYVAVGIENGVRASATHARQPRKTHALAVRERGSRIPVFVAAGWLLAVVIFRITWDAWRTIRATEQGQAIDGR
jgi:hypothetical protein